MSNNNDIDEVIKEELLGKIMNEDGVKPKKSKVYPKIASLLNLGRTYFVSGSEVMDKGKYANFQMAQKYGSELYGVSAQQKDQRTTSSSKGIDQTNTGTGSGRTTGSQSSGLIKCTIHPFLKIPASVKNESSENSVQQFKADLSEFINKINTDNSDWAKDNAKDMDTLNKAKNMLNNDKADEDVWKSISEVFTKDSWKTKFNSDIVNLTKKWKSLSTANAKKGSERSGTDAELSDNSDWDPNNTYKIDIETNFDESWFKRKFKSGVLNKALMLFKTQAAKNYNNGNVMKDHVYTADEMLPQDARKLDSIQWKMTNKVAKDFVKLALGWSRNKEINQATGMPTQIDLVENSSFGKKMASKALDNRGILGRLKQKLFSGGQNSNTISVVFQLADPYDGSWKFVKPEKPTNEPISDDEQNNDAQKDNGGGEQQVNESSLNLGHCEFKIPITESVMENILKEVYEEELNESIDERIFEYLNKGE